MLLEKVQMIATACDESEKSLVEDMVVHCGEYVSAVTTMEATARNFAGRTGEDLRNAREETDSARTIAHNAAISSIKIVNRLCARHDLPPVYEGPDERRKYGDFIFALVSEIFGGRK
jgi:hypothetical protein